MRIFKWTIIIVPLLLVAVSLHYILPRHEVVRIIGVTERLETLGWNRFFYATIPSGQGEARSRDIRLIETMRRNEQTLVFRNEDTGWIWPPFFKFNSADMQARGRDLLSTSDEPVWVIVTFYGVRNSFLSIYPNVLQIKAAEGPDMRVIPWARIVFLIAVLAATFWIWNTLRRRREAREDLAEVGSDPRGGPAA